MAAPSGATTSAAFAAKCAALAARFHMTRGWVRFYVAMADGTEQLRVQSHSDCTKQYTVFYDPETDHISGCTCAAGQWQRPCCHQGAARLWIEHRKQIAARGVVRYVWQEGA